MPTSRCLLLSLIISLPKGYWHERTDERLSSPPPRYSGAFDGEDKDGTSPGELGVSKSMECDTLCLLHRHCWLATRKGCNKLSFGLLMVMI